MRTMFVHVNKNLHVYRYLTSIQQHALLVLLMNTNRIGGEGGPGGDDEDRPKEENAALFNDSLATDILGERN